TLQPTSNKEGGIFFDFPVDSSAHANIHYFTTAGNGFISGSLTANFSVTAMKTARPVFNYGFEPENTCTNPATTRFYITHRDWRSGDPLKRWWSNPVSFTLGVGSQVQLTAALTPDQWSSVYGALGNQDAATLAAFQD